ncbi:MAG: Jag N-terminal domain-containing protein [Chloroflexi bacterium]|nr:Jag N-terminal domain-containing protein [Chloroflexota bacterium]MCL5273378.1 Jag N-terminal domain-containing protein [Chloroflexota bacterium]
MSAIEITAHDIETAIKIGLAQLNLLRAETKIEVLDEGSKGVLGIGVKPARVRLTPFAEAESKAPATAAQIDAAAEPEADANESTAAVAEGPVDIAAEDESEAAPQGEAEYAGTKPGLSDESVQLAATLAQGVVDRMDLAVTCASRLVQPQGENESFSVWVDIQGRDASRLLAHQCEALDALQLVVQSMWSHQTKSNLRVTLDADRYKERREQRIQQMAQRLAERVVSSGRAITLEPMPASERRLVHIALRDHPQVTTESHGEGSDRRITIKLK